MALKKVNKNPLFVKNGYGYFPFWDTKTGKVIIQIENPSAADKPIFEDGNWNVNADTIGLTDQQKAVYWDQTKQSISDAYNLLPNSGGQGNQQKKSVLPQWVKLGVNPNQTQLTPEQPVLGVESGVGQNKQLNYGVPTPNLGEVLSPKGNYDTYTKFFKGIGPQKLFDGAMYPIDMDTSSQDFCMISSYTYKPAYADTLFEGGKSGEALAAGIKSGGNKKNRLASVYLPMPGQVADANAVNWGSDELGALAADAMNNMTGNMIGAGVGALASLFGMGDAGGGVAVADMINKVRQLKGGSDFNELAGSTINSKLLNMAGYSVSPETILARKSGVIPNNNTELLFKGVSMRSFTLIFAMSPRSPEEADQVRKIIRFFKFNSAPKKRGSATGEVAGGSSFFLGTPNIFEVKFMTSLNGKPVENPSVGMMKPMAMKAFKCNYTPDSLWAAYCDGQPVQVVMTADLLELEPVFDTDYIGEQGQNNNLRPVPENAVGW